MCCVCKHIGGTANPELVWEGKGAGKFLTVITKRNPEGQVGGNRMKEGEGVRRRGGTLGKEKYNIWGSNKSFSLARP